MNRTRLLAGLGLVVAAGAVALPAQAHIEISYPPTRYLFAGTTGEGQKVGPCATGTPSGVVTELQAGSMITVTFDEIINHTGHFRFALDTDDDGVDDFDIPGGYDDLTVDGNIIGYLTDDGSTEYEYTFQLPNVNCDKCTLQIMQVMTDKPPYNPQGPNFNDLYYWCSDLKLTGATEGTGGGGAGAGGEGGGPASTATGAGGDGTTTTTTTTTSGAGGQGGTDATSTATTGGAAAPADDEGCSVANAGGNGERGDGLLALLLALGVAGAVRRRSQP